MEESRTGVTQSTGADASDLALLRETARGWLNGERALKDAGDMGFLGLLTPESSGGSGWRPVEAAVVAEEMGRALSPLGWLGNLVAGPVLSLVPEHRDKWTEVLAGAREVGVCRLDPHRIEQRAGTVTGQVEVEASSPSLLVLLDPTTGTKVVDVSDPGVEVSRADGIDPLRPSVRVTFRSAPVTPATANDVALIEETALILRCADSLGALSTAAELIRRHLCERMAFGRPLAAFQALQHRLADLAVLEAACLAVIRRVTKMLAEGGDERARRHSVASVHTYFASRVTTALDDCIQLAGGIGFTFEFPVHLAMRRSLANSFAIRPRNASVLDIDPSLSVAEGASEQEQNYRQSARAVITRNRPYEVREGHRAPESDEQEARLRHWYRTLFDHKLLGGSWPVEWGGSSDHKPIHDLIVTEELIRARAPRPIDQVNLAAHLILRFGTDQQRARYLPRIRSGEDVWCQLFSEPDCGSDLAGIRARAEQQPDGSWRLAGQKTWTTDGHWAQMGVALLRTSSGPRRHHGLTAFLVPMGTPGIVVRPKLTIGGAYEFNDVFLDGAALAPDCVLGTVGEGWSVAMSGLELERFGVGGNVLMLQLLLEDLAVVAAAVAAGGQRGMEQSVLRNDFSSLAADTFAARAFVADHIEHAMDGTDRPGDASVAKLLYTETYNRIARRGAELVAEHAPLPRQAEAAARRLVDAWLWSRALTISGGSSEVMRNIISRRRLGLPQDS